MVEVDIEACASPGRGSLTAAQKQVRAEDFDSIDQRLGRRMEGVRCRLFCSLLCFVEFALPTDASSVCGSHKAISLRHTQNACIADMRCGSKAKPTSWLAPRVGCYLEALTYTTKDACKAHGSCIDCYDPNYIVQIIMSKLVEGSQQASALE